MDDRTFDSLVRELASGITRRSALGALVGLVGWEWADSAEARKHRNHKNASHKKAHKGGSKQKRRQKHDRNQVQEAKEKVGVCHHTGSATNPLVFIEVAPSAVPAHLAHGDAVNVDLQTDVNNCGTCGNVCTGDACNTPVCSGGACGTKAVNCDDDNACTTDTCDPVTGCAHTPINCDDGNACTDDSCDPATGCVHRRISCDDNNACTEDSCDPATGCVHRDISCDDGDPCTTDSCNPATGCVNEQVICPEGQACLNGECVGCLGTDCAGIVFGCEGDPECNCFITVENVGFCHRNQLCAGLQSCVTSADCPADHRCSLSTCCGPEQGRICIRPCAGTGGLREAVAGGPTTTGR